jgi:hypothetical protein
VNPVVLEMLARAFVTGEPTLEAILARAAKTLGKRWRWLEPVAVRYLQTFQPGDLRPQPLEREIYECLRDDRGVVQALTRYGPRLQVAHWVVGEPGMQPVLAARAWPVPAIATEGALADWLRLSPAELAWFADLHGLEARLDGAEVLRNYRYRLVRKKSGSLRLLEAPKQRLKTMQRQLVDEILAAVPVHDAAHGFVSGRSTRSFAEPHAGQAVVLRMDLRDFFPSISAARAQALFRTIGFPQAVSDRLGGLCTNAAARAVLRRLAQEVGLDRQQTRELQETYGRGHLPQGAPTSPALANLCFYRTDCRLAGLARAAGVGYTRYADDLAFSGGERFGRIAKRFAAEVASIVQESGFALNHRKTRVMRRGVRQHLSGLVVNAKLNVRRDEFDRLKATLTNCVRRGPEDENRDGRPEFRAHLAGRVSYVESVNPARGARLRPLLEAIQWPER